MTDTVAVPVEASQLKRVVLEASAIANRYWGIRLTVNHKADGSVITEADTEVNDFLHGALMRLLPGSGWLSEETRDDRNRLANEWVWVVDPLDGTNEFVRGTPEFAISVGLVHLGSAVLGCVVNPASGEGGVGRLGRGTEFWGGLEPRDSAKSLSEARASVSRTETNDGTVVPYLGLVGTTITVGSVAYKLLRTAAGHNDLTFSVQHKSEWDVCGGAALLEAAGKVYQRLDGEPLRFNQSDTRIRSGALAGDRGLVDRLQVDMDRTAHSLRIHPAS